MSWCKGFETRDEAERNYPNSVCENCELNDYEYNSGIVTCSKLTVEGIANANREEK